jgi:hypothetical protein
MQNDLQGVANHPVDLRNMDDPSIFLKTCRQATLARNCSLGMHVISTGPVAEKNKLLAAGLLPLPRACIKNMHLQHAANMLLHAVYTGLLLAESEISPTEPAIFREENV